MKRRSTSRAFTLIELLLVLVILAVLAAVVIPSLVGRAEQAKHGATIASIASLKAALKAYEVDNGKFPTTSEGLLALVEKPASAQNWQHKYIDKLPTDAWGNNFDYKGPDAVGEGADFKIISPGPDHIEGNEDDLDENSQ